jgi:hypothetical protein
MITLYTPGRVTHRATDADAPQTLCHRPTVDLHPLPRDPWARVGAEAGTRGPCARCGAAERTLSRVLQGI